MPARAFIALLPFDLLVQSESRVEPARVAIGGHDVVLYWPFWDEPTVGRRFPPIRSAAVPSRSGAPFYTVPPLDVVLEVVPPVGQSFANGLRIDVLDAADDSTAASVAAALLQQFRVRTNQWWIGHAHREGEPLVRVSYSIDEQGALLGRDCSASADVQSRLGIERPVTPAIFNAACASLNEGSVVPAHWDVVYDAVYFSIYRQDWRRAVLDACIACDLAVLYDAIRAGGAVGKPELVVRNALSDRDLLKNLRDGLPKLFGRRADYREADPDGYEHIRALWAARVSIAHGLVPTVGNFARAVALSGSESADLILAAIRLLTWLSELPFPESLRNAP